MRPHNTKLGLLALAVSSTASAASSVSECLHTRTSELAALSACGDAGSLNYCISHLPVSQFTSSDDSLLTADLERCFFSAGCTPQEASIEAFWTLRRCDSNPRSGSDLRRRQGGVGDGIAANAGLAGPGAIIAARDPAPAPTPAPIPQAATTTAAAAAANSSPATCFTETQVSVTVCPVQSTGTSSGQQLSCYPTTAPSSVCAAGLICKADPEGNPSCMYAQTSFGVAGTVIAIFFAVAITVSIVSICFLCCRERRSQKKLERAAEAAKIAKDAKLAAAAAKKPSSSVTGAAGAGGMTENQPLMPAPPAKDLPPMIPQQYQGSGTGHEAPAEGHGGQGVQFQQQPLYDDYYGNGSNGQPNPFQDPHPLR
ncbi:hypothetical protein QBC46DRAFT_23798 [Diplogelasinospora grovesii]|uniref:Uncharacterized protein n=1 Tax=Diplogelasinospora grovesii TaxID=303347 RepID=A0AAN6N215_9PEZI|nr:hypothetical protein QBC46DRAFT_23798 [Diplogelasinospora grovesii]